ncbi:hypothetical protein AB0K05_41450 [Nonomuraea sp. NPDC049486]|uniref:RNA polymerase sigma factor n=1 Tax=Nonomuraea sp. NPDC049486 TaxID=3155773 RepID=UPI00341382DD
MDERRAITVPVIAKPAGTPFIPGEPMWHSLSDDAREVIEDLRHRYGDRLYDYLRTVLSSGEAGLALAGTLVSACLHAERVVDDEHLRAWLYGLARAHRTLAAQEGSASHLDQDGPLGEALAELSPGQREVLDLAVRHELSDFEIALIFDVGAVQIEALVAEAREHVEAWLAVNAAGADLARDAPILAAPDTLTDELLLAEPLGEKEALWRADGFPVQPSLLPDARHTPSIRLPAAADDRPFRNWEQGSEHVEEFWRRRPDEADPEARLSLRPVVPTLRVCMMVVGVVAGVSLIGMAWSGLHSARQAPTSVPAAETITLIATHPPFEPAVEEPPLVATSAPVPHRTGSPSDDRASAKPSPAVTRTADPDQATGRTGGQDPTGRATTTSSRRLPKPAAPSARVFPTGISLGAARTGSFTIEFSPGSGRVVSASASDGMVVDGTRFIVSAPQAKPGCSSSRGAGTITLTWRATNTGDGRISAGTTTASGTATVHVSWTIAADKGIWIPTGNHVGDGQGHWSNCPHG